MLDIVNYNELIKGIPDSIKATKGDDTIIAILDTGCNNHSSIQGQIIHTYDAINETSDIPNNDKSLSGHGTFIAGLIAAKGTRSEIIGIAPEAKLIIVKVADSDDSVFSENVLKGLNWLSNTCPVKPNIINISLDFYPETVKDRFINIFKKFLDDEVFCFAAAQNDLKLQNSPFYPANEINVHAVGALKKQTLLNPEFISINKKVNYVVPNIEFKSTNNSFISPFRTNEGCSFATAITSASMALVMSYYKKNAINISLKDFFDQQLRTFSSDIFNYELEIYKL
ncbi:MAG: S8 family serine peptidase [Bacteroidales bacterium]|nr:S8 family serine peptidase [Bacteroidales bacterium]